MTPPGLLGTGNCADVVPFETFVKSSNERGSSPLPPGHSGGVPSCPVMPGDALPSCLGLSPREDDALGTALSSARGLQALLGETRGSSEGLVPARDPDPMALSLNITHGADEGFHIPASSLEVQRSRLGSIPLRHPKRREVWQLETR